MGKGPNPWWPLIFLTHCSGGLYFAYETAGALAPELRMYSLYINTLNKYFTL